MPESREHPETVRWQAEHDGRINAWWEAQRAWNMKVDTKLHTLSVKLTALEKKIIFVSGAAAAIGSVLGALITGIINGNT